MLTTLSQQLSWLDHWIRQAERSVRKKPEGMLIVQSGHSFPQYYVKKDASEKRGRYVSKKDTAFIAALAQKDYDIHFLKACQKQLSLLQRLEKQQAERSAYLLFQTLAEVYTSLSSPRQALVSPYVLPDQQFVDQWLDRPRSQHAFHPDDPVIMTEREERVRSKSEKIIADKLLLLHVPYFYEDSIHLSDIGHVVTDFLLLDLKERRPIRYEHFGMMEKQRYCLNALDKIEAYQRDGFILGDQFIYTFESETHVLNMRHFENMLRQHLDLSLYKNIRF